MGASRPPLEVQVPHPPRRRRPRSSPSGKQFVRKVRDDLLAKGLHPSVIDKVIREAGPGQAIDAVAMAISIHNLGGLQQLHRYAQRHPRPHRESWRRERYKIGDGYIRCNPDVIRTNLHSAGVVMPRTRMSNERFLRTVAVAFSLQKRNRLRNVQGVKRLQQARA